MGNKALDDLKINPKMMREMSIKEELNKLFYTPNNYDAELEMLKYQYDQETEERLGLHASSVTNAGNKFCFREQIVNILYMEHKQKGRKVPDVVIKTFKANNARNSNNPINLQRIFEEGKSVGTKWQRMFIRGGIGVKEDMDVSRFVNEYDLSYTPDGIITLNGKTYVVEIKSSNKNQFDKMKKHPSGQKQLKFYMYFEKQRQHIDGGFVLVDCKDNSEFKIFYEDGPDEKTMESIQLLEKIQRIKRKALKIKKLPPCKCGKCISL